MPRSKTSPTSSINSTKPGKQAEKAKTLAKIKLPTMDLRGPQKRVKLSKLSNSFMRKQKKNFKS